MELCSKGNYLDLLIFNLDCMLSTFLLMNSSFNLPWHGQNLFRISCSQRSNCFSKVHLDSKTWISELLLPIQRAHTYSNNLWIVVSEKHQFLAFERKGTAHFCIGGKWWSYYYFQDIPGLSIQKGTSQALWTFKGGGRENGSPGDTLTASPSLTSTLQQKVPSTRVC